VKSYLGIILILSVWLSKAQPMPSVDEKFPFLMTFSKKADKTWGDDDFVQTIFFVIPEANKSPVYIRVFDPDNGGQHDENRGGFNSKTKFSLYGGKGAHSGPDAKTYEPKGDYKSGTLMLTKTFGEDPDLDDHWYTFGPLNPGEGELQTESGGYVFKVVIEGLDGDDGNLYKFFLSKANDKNIAVEGGNAFCYEYSFRLTDQVGFVSHIYPFLPRGLLSININIFDYDDEGIVRTVTIAKKGQITNSTAEGTWTTTQLKIMEEELNTSMDIQFIKKKEVKNNNIVVYITNQYNEAIRFYTLPIGGVPRYKYKIDATKTK
jgi:hypothetical protein